MCVLAAPLGGSTTHWRSGRLSVFLYLISLAQLTDDTLRSTRIEGDDQFEQVGDGYTYLEKEDRRKAGVSVAVQSDILKKLEELPVPIHQQVMTLRLQLRDGRFATQTGSYAPTLIIC